MSAGRRIVLSEEDFNDSESAQSTATARAAATSSSTADADAIASAGEASQQQPPNLLPPDPHPRSVARPSTPATGGEPGDPLNRAHVFVRGHEYRAALDILRTELAVAREDQDERQISDLIEFARQQTRSGLGAYEAGLFNTFIREAEANLGRLRSRQLTPGRGVTTYGYAQTPRVGGWGFAIFFFGLIGGAIGYFALKRTDPHRADHVLKWGLIITAISIAAWILLWVIVLAIVAHGASSGALGVFGASR